jgi:hypothetical protein
MASAHIEISGSATRLNGKLRSLLDQVQDVGERSAQLKAIFDQVALGGDFASLGEALGISAADAETVYNLLGSANTELHGAFITQMLARCG